MMGRTPQQESQASLQKTRRSHKKSRRGCTECKRRHIRCDEGRPACTNCSIADRACSFLEAPPPTVSQPQSQPQQQSQLPPPPSAPLPQPPPPHISHHPQQPYATLQQQYPHSPAESSKSPGVVTTGSSSGLGSGLSPHEVKHEPTPPPPRLPPPQPQPPNPYYHQQQQSQSQPQPPQQQQQLPSFNDAFANTPASSVLSPIAPTPQPRLGAYSAHHLMLLHHAQTAMDSDILWHAHTPAIVDIAIRYAEDCPFLIDQLLAFAAMHIAHERREVAAKWRHHATELQTRAVTAFSKDTENPQAVIKHNVPRFLFATMLSLHVLAETLEYYRTDLDIFIDHYIECVQLHKGIRTVITPSWPELLETELKPFLYIVTSQRPQDPSVGDECRSLHALIDASAAAGGYLGTDEEARQGCHEATRMLQWAFDLSARLPQPGLPHGVSGFSIMIPVAFTNVLRRHVPEALVVMAYFGVLLHRTRRYWVCGNNGAFVIQAIADRLGPQWEDAMRWPLRVLIEERD